MHVDRIFTTFLGVEVLFLAGGIIMLVFAFITQANATKEQTIDSAARNLLLQECPLRAAIANGVLILVTFLFSIPGMLIPTSRGWLKVHGYMVVICAVFTLVIGLTIWFQTLSTRQNLSLIWNTQGRDVQSLLQQELNCCGYLNSTSPAFVEDAVCRNPQVAASKVGCVKPFSTLANNFLDLVFTGAFGIVGVDMLLILTLAIVLKDRKEKERYRHIDEKNGEMSF